MALFLLPVLILLPGLNAFPYPPTPEAYSDLAITHYPNAVYLKQALSAWHSLPLWSYTILSGYPFAANPLSGLWYPPGWLVVPLPLPLGFNLLVILHLLWGGIGFFLLLRSEGVKSQAALLGALAFEAMPKLFAHYGAGHVTLIYAVCWTPWLLLSAAPLQVREMDEPGRRWRAFRWALPSILLALIFMADVRWAVFAGAAWWAYALWRGSISLPQETRAIPKLWGTRLLSVTGLTILAGLLAAPLALPLLEYSRLSTRDNLSAVDVSAYALPPARLLGLVFPEVGGFHEWILYPGGVVLALALLALLWSQSRKRAAFWIVLGVVALFFALGDSLPLFRPIARLPLLDLLRVPARALFLLGMVLAALSAHSLDAMLNGLSSGETRRARLVLVSLVGFALLVPTLALVMIQNIPAGFAWGAAAVTAAAGWLLFGLHKKTFIQPLWLVGLLSLCLLELLGVNQTLYSFRSSEAVFTPAQPLEDYLKGQPGDFRVYSPSYSLPQQNAARSGLQLADGIDPLQLQSYADFMEKASGVPFTGYSVTLPPFPHGDPHTANAAYTPKPDLLGLLNVRFVAAEYDLDAPGLVLRQRFGETRLYENTLWRPRAWVQPEGVTFTGDYRTVDSLRWSPNRVVVQARGPGLLVLSEIDYPGWQVWVDGVQSTLTSPAELLRGVELPSGEHQVVFTFRPASLYLGLSLSLAGFIFLLVSVIAITRKVRS
jgi:hypothetical protein